MVDWTGLEDDILIEIEKRLVSIENYESFAAVCKSWRAAATKDKHHLKRKRFQGPWLMLPRKKSSPSTDNLELFSLSSGNTREISFFYEASKKRYLSCKDWLFIIEEDSVSVSLFHPISRKRILLPNLGTFRGYKHALGYKFIQSFILSANPNSTSDFIVVLLWDDQLGFWKARDKSWTAIETYHDRIFRIIYHEEKLYALPRTGGLLRCDVHGPNPTQLRLAFDLPPRGLLRYDVYGTNPTQLPPETEVPIPYLVEFLKKFYLVNRHVDFYQTGHYETREFKIYEMNTDDGERIPIKDLGNNALFLDDKSSFFLKCSYAHNYKPNCIYFWEENINAMRIYHLSDGSNEPFFHDKVVWSNDEPMTWIGPSFGLYI